MLSGYCIVEDVANGESTITTRYYSDLNVPTYSQISNKSQQKVVSEQMPHPE